MTLAEVLSRNQALPPKPPSVVTLAQLQSAGRLPQPELSSPAVLWEVESGTFRRTAANDSDKSRDKAGTAEATVAKKDAKSLLEPLQRPVCFFRKIFFQI
jgi:hypothetical protein